MPPSPARFAVSMSCVRPREFRETPDWMVLLLGTEALFVRKQNEAAPAQCAVAGTS